jgi:hypothetical protein
MDIAFKAHLATQGTDLPGYVEQELDDYLKCGHPYPGPCGQGADRLPRWRAGLAASGVPSIRSHQVLKIQHAVYRVPQEGSVFQIGFDLRRADRL